MVSRVLITMAAGANNPDSGKKMRDTPTQTASPSLQDVRASSAATLVTQKAGNNVANLDLLGRVSARDTMLASIEQRLRNIAMLQRAELFQKKEERKWFRSVAKGHAGAALPDPQRWKAVTALYAEALRLVCRGELGAGAAQLAKAIELETATLPTLPNSVKDATSDEERAAPVAPGVLATLADGEVGPACAVPAAIDRELQSILNVVEGKTLAPPVGARRPRRAWWTDEAEAEPEDGAKKA